MLSTDSHQKSLRTGFVLGPTQLRYGLRCCGTREHGLCGQMCEHQYIHSIRRMFRTKCSVNSNFNLAYPSYGRNSVIEVVGYPARVHRLHVQLNGDLGGRYLLGDCSRQSLHDSDNERWLTDIDPVRLSTSSSKRWLDIRLCGSIPQSMALLQQKSSFTFITLLAFLPVFFLRYSLNSLVSPRRCKVLAENKLNESMGTTIRALQLFLSGVS